MNLRTIGDLFDAADLRGVVVRCYNERLRITGQTPPPGMMQAFRDHRDEALSVCALARRLDAGYMKIQRLIEEGKTQDETGRSIDQLEAFWIDRLHEMEGVLVRPLNGGERVMG